MCRWLLRLFICGLLCCVLADEVANGQDETDLFNQPSDIFQIADPPAENGQDDEEATIQDDSAARSLFPGLNFGNQLSQETLDQANEFYSTAEELVQQGDLAGALENIQQALTINRNHYPSYYLRGRIEREQGFTDQAIRSLTNAVTVNRGGYDAYVELGLTYMDADRYRDAIINFQRALLGRPADPQILYQLGLAQAEFGYSQILGSAQQENIQAAIASFDLALKIQADYPEALFERGSAQLQLGLLEEALEDLARAVELDPQNPEPVAQLGFASLQRASREANRPRGLRAQIVADYEDSIDALTKYFSLVPENPDLEEEANTEIMRENVYVARAIANIGLGTELPDRSRDYYLRAIQDTESAQELNPDFASPYFQKGVAQRMLGDLDAAVDSFTAALERSPGESEALLRRGIVFFWQGDYELARADFRQAGLFSPNPARAKFWSGLANAKLGQYKRAIMNYSSALRYQGIFPYASLNRGLAHMKVGRFRPAIADFNEVLRSDKNNVTARSMRAKAQRLLAETS